MSVIHYPASALPPIDVHTALRYAGARGEVADLTSRLLECASALEGQLRPTVIYEILPVQILGNTVDFDLFSVTSHSLADHLLGCSRAAVFVATVGLAPDRLIARYSPASLAHACLADALGTERIEALCDLFCTELATKEGALTSRFSPGYGDLPLALQRNIFSILDCARHGVTLNDSLLMSPTKSVSAIVGIR